MDTYVVLYIIDEWVFLNLINKLLDPLGEFVGSSIDMEMSENDLSEPLVLELLKLFPIIEHNALFSGSYKSEIFLIVCATISVELEDKENAKHTLLSRLTYGCQIEALVGTEDDVAGFGLLEISFFADSHEPPEFEAVFNILMVIVNGKILLTPIRMTNTMFNFSFPNQIIIVVYNSQVKDPIGALQSQINLAE